MERRIEAFERDEEGAWVARLECGHPQHVRHSPPFQLRPWVMTELGRREHLGTRLECPFCDMPGLPDNVSEYKRTPQFTEHSLPAALQNWHDTKPGVWGRIVLASGRVAYEILDSDPIARWVLKPGVVGVVAPEQPHRLCLVGPVSLHVEFLK